MNKIKYPILLLLCLNSFEITMASASESFSNRSLVEVEFKKDTLSSELNRVFNHCRQLLLSDTAYATEQSFRLTDDIIYTTNAEGYLKSFNSEGYWSDLDYQSQQRSAWLPSWHLYRLMLFCRAWHHTNQSAYLQAVHKGLDYWIKHDFQCENWWHNQINIPYVYSSLMIMLNKEATPAELAYLNTVLSKRVQQKNPTGQNKLWQHDIEARIALFNNDVAAFKLALDGMKSLIEISTKEGVQPDYSFHQHGAMLQFGNYGFHYVNSLLFWITSTARSQFAFESDKEKILLDYCSNGLRWTIFNKAMDLTAVGRQLRNNCDLRRGEDLNNNFNLIKSTYPVESRFFSLDGFGINDAKPNNLKGNKSYWRSDYMIHLKGGAYMMSVKMHGDYVKKTESINSENLMGAFLNDGVSLIQRTGEEYRNIEPIWKWTMLPGITCDTTLDPADINVFKTSNPSGFVGQTSDGISGISAMVYNREGVKACKSYFFTDNLMVALGSGIESSDIKNVITTINQRFYNHHNIVTSSLLNKSNQWMWHDSIGYFFPGDQQAKFKIDYCRGDWTKVDNVSKSEPVMDSVLSIYLSHNKHNSYAYFVQPNCGLAEINKPDYLKDVKILSNTPDIQAIQNRDGVMAVFYKPSSLKVSEAETILTNHPCILIYKLNHNEKEVWVSDPTRKLKSIQIQIRNKTINVTLPIGDYAGSTVNVLVP